MSKKNNGELKKRRLITDKVNTNKETMGSLEENERTHNKNNINIKNKNQEITIKKRIFRRYAQHIKLSNLFFFMDKKSEKTSEKDWVNEVDMRVSGKKASKEKTKTSDEVLPIKEVDHQGLLTNKDLKETLIAQNHAEQAACEAGKSLNRIKQIRREVSAVMQECQALYDNSQALQGLAVDANFKLSATESVQKNMSVVSEEIEVILDDVVTHSGKIEEIEAQVKDQFEKGQHCLDEINELANIVYSKEKDKESQREKVDNLVKEIEVIRCHSSDLELKVKNELMLSNEVRSQISNIRDEAKILLIEIREGLNSDAYKLDADLEKYKRIIDNLQDEFSHVKHDHEALKSHFDQLYDSISEKQKKTDDLLEKQSEKNIELIHFIDQLNQSKTTSSEEVLEAKKILSEIEDLTRKNESVRDNISKSIQEIRLWNEAGEDEAGENGQGRTNDQKILIDLALSEFGEKQKLLDILTQDSQRMHGLISQNIDESQQLNERVDQLIDEGKKQQKKFQQETEEFFNQAKVREQKLIHISANSDKAIEVIETAQQQADSISVESDKVLHQVTNLRQDSQNVLDACRKVLLHNVKIKKQFEGGFDHSLSALKSTGRQFREENEQVKGEILNLQNRFESILAKCEDTLTEADQMESLAREQKDKSVNYLSRAEQLILNIQKKKLQFSSDVDQINDVMVEAKTLSNEASTTQEALRITLDNLSQRAERTDQFFSEIEEVKVGLFDLLTQNKNRNELNNKQEERINTLLEECQSTALLTADTLNKCEQIQTETGAVSSQFAKDSAALLAMTEALQERQLKVENLVQLHEEKNRQIDSFLKNIENKDKNLGQIETALEGYVSELIQLIDKNKEIQSDVTENLDFVKSTKLKIDSQGIDNEEILRKFQSQEDAFLEKQASLQQLENNSQLMFSRVSEMSEVSEKAKQKIERLILDSSEQKKRVDEALVLVQESATESDNTCLKTERLSRKVSERLVETEILQEKVNEAVESHSILANKSEDNLKEMYQVLNDLLRFKAQSAVIQSSIEKNHLKNDQYQNDIDQVKLNCESLVEDVKNSLTKGEVQLRKINSVEIRVDEATKNLVGISQKCEDLNNRADYLVNEQGSRLSAIVDISERLEQQQKQSDRLILQQSQRNDELSDVIIEQTKIIEENQQQIDTTQKLQEKIVNLNNVGSRTQRLVVDHIKNVSALTHEFKEKGERVHSKQAQAEQLLLQLSNKSEEIEALLERSNAIKVSAEKSVDQCREISDSIDGRITAINHEQHSIQEMAQTTRRFEQSCFEIKTSLEEELDSVRIMREEAAQWVSETEEKVVNTLKNNQDSLAVAAENQKMFQDRIVESDKRQEALQQSNELLLEQLKSAEALFSRWESRWGGLEDQQARQAQLLQKTQHQLDEVNNNRAYLTALVEKKEHQSQQLDENLQQVLTQAESQKQSLMKFEQLVQDGRGREEQLSTQLEKSIAINQTLSERLQRIEPHVSGFTGAIEKAEQCADKAGFASKEIQVTQRELQVAFDEIRNEMKSLQIRVNMDSSVSPIQSTNIQTPQATSHASPIVDATQSESIDGPIESQAEEIAVKKRAEDLDAIGLLEPNFISNKESSEPPKKSFKSFLY